jgi:succinate-acetate transporter protein
MSFATILIPGSGVAAAYTHADEFANALGIYLITWFIFTFLLTYVPVFPTPLYIHIRFFSYLTATYSIVTLRKSIAFIALFSLLSTTFAILAAANFSGKAVYVFFLSPSITFNCQYSSAPLQTRKDWWLVRCRHCFCRLLHRSRPTPCG